MMHLPPPLAPSGFDQVVVLLRGSRNILLSWDPPAALNGVLLNYTILQGGVGVASVSPSELEYNVSGLLPFSEYSFSVLACNSAGCTESPSVTTTTLEDGECSFIILVFTTKLSLVSFVCNVMLNLFVTFSLPLPLSSRGCGCSICYSWHRW